MDEKQDIDTQPHAPTKSELIRDALVFQFKLLVDGIRDFILIPVSFGAAIISLLKPGNRAGTEFYDVVAFGRTTEKKINLFSVADKVGVDPVAEEIPDLDTLVGEFEAFVKKEYAGDRFAAARERLSKLRESVGDQKLDTDSTDNDPDKNIQQQG